MAVTWFGGSSTSYAENGGLSLGVVSALGVWADRAKTVPLTDLRDGSGGTVSTVTTAPNGHFYFGVNAHPGTVYVDFGLGPYAVDPIDVADRLVTAEAALATATDAIASLAAAPSAVTFSAAAAWSATTTFPAGKYVRAPDGSLWFVNTTYTSAGSYGAGDTSNAVKVIDPFFTQAEAALAFAPIGQQLAEQLLYVGDVLAAPFVPNPHGDEMQGTGTATGLLVEADDPSDGVVTVGVYRFRPTGTGAGLLCMGVVVIPVNKVTPAAPLLLGASGWSHTATTTSGNPVVTDTNITAAMAGQPVPPVAGIPANSFVGAVIVGTSWRISSDPVNQVDVPATASGTVTVAIAPQVAWLAHDRLLPIVLKDTGTVFKGAGLKVRVAQGSTTFTIPTAPGDPSTPTAVTTSTTVALSWAGGSGAAGHQVWKNGIPVARLFNQTTWTDSNAVQGVSAAYKVLAWVPGAVSNFTSELTIAPSAVWSLLPQSGTLPAPLDPTVATVTRGTNTSSTTAAQVTTASGHQKLSLRSGVGSTPSTGPTNDPQDRVFFKVIKDTTQRRAWGFRGLVSPLDSSALLEIYLGTDDLSLTGTLANFLRVGLQPTGCDISGKAATYDPTGEGNGTTVGSFQRFTDTTYATNILTGASRVSGGLISHGFTMTPGTFYGFKCIADAVTGSGGTARQLVSIYAGTAAQYGTDGSALPLIYTANLTNRFVLARPAGYFDVQQLGKQTLSTQVEGWDFQDYADILPIAA